MIIKKDNTFEKVGYILVLLMVMLQGFYAVFAYLDPALFYMIRGTELVVSGDAAWVKIYASRTLFIALIIGYLLHLRSYKILMWAALFGVVMPVVDASLAYQAHASWLVVIKHIATVVYLLVIFFVLRVVVKKSP